MRALDPRRERDLHRAGHAVAQWLLPVDLARNLAFWKRQVSILTKVSELRDGLTDSARTFASSQTRASGIALLSDVNLIWQTARELAGVNGRDDALKEMYLPIDWDTIPHEATYGWAVDAEAFDLMNTLYSWESCRRHPTPPNFASIEWMFDHRWPDVQSAQLRDGSIFARAMTTILIRQFCPKTGFEGDCNEKSAMFADARKARRAAI